MTALLKTWAQLCLKAIPRVFTVSSRNNIEEMEEVIRADRDVDAYEVGIDEDCTLLIARRQPTARDLRLVMAISRIVTDLERSGDKAAKIANKARKMPRCRTRWPLVILISCF